MVKGKLVGYLTGFLKEILSLKVKFKEKNVFLSDLSVLQNRAAIFFYDNFTKKNTCKETSVLKVQMLKTI